ncbi:MAG: serine protease [Candidatus Eremiobacteraeota bacterium]|nr:serine protease [Candidatus Eremiobacteraeota bacterium]
MSAQPSLVRISGVTQNGTRVFMSGVVIAASGGLDVATSATKSSELSHIRVQTQLGESLPVENTHYVDGYDLAVLRTASSKGHYTAARLATDVADGAPVDVWTYAERNAPRMMTASMWGRAVRFDLSHSNRLGIRCEQCEYDDAGAGIFAKDGSLVGIIAARWNWSDAQGRFSLMEGEPISAIAAVTASK